MVMWHKAKKLILFILLLAALCKNVASKKKFKRYKFLHTKAEFNRAYLEKHSLEISSNGTTINVILNVVQDFKADPWLEMGVSFKAHKADSFRSVFAYDLNVCNILGKESGADNFMQAWINNFWKYGNMPRSCPILKGHYFWNELKLEQVSLPDFLISGKYRVLINTYFRKEQLLSAAKRESVANLTIFMEIK